MKSRDGSFIGVKVQPSNFWASGIWTLGECFQSRLSNQWPRANLSISSGQTFFDATMTRSVVISPSVSSSYTPLTYLWEKSVDGVSWSQIEGQASQSISLSGLSTSDDNGKYRLIAEAGLRKQTSPVFTVYVDNINMVWSSQPSPQTVAANQYAFLSAYAYGQGINRGYLYYNVSFQWQMSTDGGQTWADTGFTSSSINLYAQTSMNGYRYRLKGTGGGVESYSIAVTLTVT